MWYSIYIYIYTLYYILLKLVFFHCHPSLPSQRLASRLASLAMGTWESHWNSSTNVQPIDPKTKLWGFALFGQEESGMLADSTTKLESANRTKSHDLLSSQPATLLVNASAFPSSAARCKREMVHDCTTSYDVSRNFTGVTVGHQHWRFTSLAPTTIKTHEAINIKWHSPN